MRESLTVNSRYFVSIRPESQPLGWMNVGLGGAVTRCRHFVGLKYNQVKVVTAPEVCCPFNVVGLPVAVFYSATANALEVI